MTIVIILIFNLHRLEHHFNQYCVLKEHCHEEWKAQYENIASNVLVS